MKLLNKFLMLFTFVVLLIAGISHASLKNKNAQHNSTKSLQIFNDGPTNNFFKRPSHSKKLQGKNNSDDFQKILDAFVSREYVNNISGIALTLQCPSINNNQSLTYNAGKMSIDGEDMQMDTMFHIGSITKSMISVILIQLDTEHFAQGGILDKTVGDYFPEYTRWVQIPIRRLLNMTSGISEYPNSLLEEYLNNRDHFFSADEILDSVKDRELEFPPGTGYNYSGIGYVLAGKIIEKITHNSLANILQERIFKPLDIRNAYYIPHLPTDDLPPLKIPLLMSGYFHHPGDETVWLDSRYDSLSLYNAAGAVISNSEDLNHYIQELFKPKEEGGKLLTKTEINHQLLALVNDLTGEPIKEVNDENPEGYGLGVTVVFDPNSKTPVYTHNGKTAGFWATWAYRPNKQSSFATIFNSPENMDNEDVWNAAFSSLDCL